MNIFYLVTLIILKVVISNQNFVRLKRLNLDVKNWENIYNVFISRPEKNTYKLLFHKFSSPQHCGERIYFS